MSMAAGIAGRTDGMDAMMQRLGAAARAAATVLATAPAAVKNRALRAAAAAIRRDRDAILAANALDVQAAKAAGLAPNLVDRAELDPARLEGVARGLEDIADLPDPVGAVTDEWTRPNGLRIQRVRTPLGVIGVIYESRPNVTCDAGGLCLKAGNAVILRGGREAFQSNRALAAALAEGLEVAGLPAAAVQLVPTTDRAAVGEMLRAHEWIDVIVPRGGKSLIQRVQDEARMPVFAHLEGRCTVYVHRAADPQMAVAIAVNAKMRRTSICGSAETLLVDRDAARTLMKPILDGLFDAGCAVHGDAATAALDPRVQPAQAQDWDTEWLAPVISAALVDGPDQAIAHIRAHGSSHTESIVTADQAVADAFLARVDSAIVMHNASTQFADGGEFGMGAEIGIATGRMHARGPVGVEQLCSFKYVVRGAGQTRP